MSNIKCVPNQSSSLNIITVTVILNEPKSRPIPIVLTKTLASIKHITEFGGAFSSAPLWCQCRALSKIAAIVQPLPALSMYGICHVSQSKMHDGDCFCVGDEFACGCVCLYTALVPGARHVVHSWTDSPPDCSACTKHVADAAADARNLKQNINRQFLECWQAMPAVCAAGSVRMQVPCGGARA